MGVGRIGYAVITDILAKSQDILVKTVARGFGAAYLARGAAPDFPLSRLFSRSFFPMSRSICRWGILSTAGIARKNWLAIRNSGNGTVVAVASRGMEKAQAFIRECQSHAPFAREPEACESYAALLARPDIDAVYIPLPTGLRKEWVLRAAAAGKHVLAEKPAGVCAADVAEMIAACAQNKVQFMDGVMFMHSLRMDALRRVLDDGRSVGPLRRICSQFSFAAPEGFMAGDIRSSGALEPAGCLGDLGWYIIRFSLWAMRYRMPVRVSGRMLAQVCRGDGSPPVPTEFSGELFFADGASAGFYCSFHSEHQQWSVLSGTKGFARIPDFVSPFFGSEVSFEVTNARFAPRGCDFAMEDHTLRVAVPEYANSAPNAQESNLFRTFGELALSGEPDPHWGDIALKTQRVLDACLESAMHDGRMVEMGG